MSDIPISQDAQPSGVTGTFSEPTTDKISFFGQGSTYFGIVALNVVLTLVTAGLYYPWAKAAYRKYIWNETEFKGSRFVFNGTGKEMFKGFIIAYVLFLSFYGMIAMTAMVTYGWMFLLLFYILMIVLIPFAIFGAWRYRVSRTSWKGIFFQFDGELKEFIKMYLKNLFFVIITFGIYGAWMHVNIQKYLFEHTGIGELKLGFYGDGTDLFVINLVGIFLSYITLGLYLPVFIKNRFDFSINHSTLSDEQTTKRFQSTLTKGVAWKTIMGNVVLLVVTLGLAFPWAFMRSMRMYCDNTLIPNNFDFENLSQTDKNYRDATGDEMSDILDIGFDF